MSSLCIVPGEKVWGVMIDIHVLLRRRKYFRCMWPCCNCCLRTAIVPAERFDVGEDYTLKVNGTPIMASFTRVGGRYVYDPSEEEELGGDERIHITRR